MCLKIQQGASLLPDEIRDLYFKGEEQHRSLAVEAEVDNDSDMWACVSVRQSPFVVDAEARQSGYGVPLLQFL